MSGLGSRFLIILALFIGSFIADLTLSTVSTWNGRIHDNLFRLRSAIPLFQPPYDSRIVHVDLDDSSISQLGSYYLDRSYHARVIGNLSEMGVAAQLFDFIFAAPSNEKADSLLFDSVREAGNVYFGLAFDLSQPRQGSGPGDGPNQVDAYLGETRWKLTPRSNPATIHGAGKGFITFLPLAEAARGLGFLNVTPDADGVFRRIPLVVRYQDGFYPSLPFRVLCDYLGVEPEQIVLDPGRAITLNGVMDPTDSGKRNIVIPIDKRGNLVINFIGPWGRMNHYHFADVWTASDDRDELEIWKEELAGRIAVVSAVATGSSDIGPVPTDTYFPLSGINANVMNTILTESFIRELGRPLNTILLLPLLLLILWLSLQRSTLMFFCATVAGATLYLSIGALLFLQAGIIIDLATPLLLSVTSLVALLVLRAFENARVLFESDKQRSLVEKELDIGRTIQSGFLPGNLPEVSGWDMEAYFRPARQVAGDFYDVFYLAERRLVGFVIADVCDKGVGAALFMALIRTLIRSFTVQAYEALPAEPGEDEQAGIGETLHQTVRRANDYVTGTHGGSHMFATLFIGVLDPATGSLNYINCGHEPPVILSSGRDPVFLTLTGPLFGVFQGIEFQPKQIRFEPGELFFGYTDGITEATNGDGELFTKQRLLFTVGDSLDSPKTLVEKALEEIDTHVGDSPQADDITMLAIRRNQAGTGQ